ncbi:MAG: hypothetical protein IPL46_17280 [Saprospiraceae bacterium]|nr:hypothetical protein [Saprospiraceae bacterium]
MMRFKIFQIYHLCERIITKIRDILPRFVVSIIRDLLAEGVRKGELEGRRSFDLPARRILFDIFGILEFGHEDVLKQGKDAIFQLTTGVYLKGLEYRRVTIV